MSHEYLQEHQTKTPFPKCDHFFLIKQPVGQWASEYDGEPPKEKSKPMLGSMQRLIE